MYSAGVVFETTSPVKRDIGRRGGMVERPVERVDHLDQPVDGAVIGGARGDAGAPARTGVTTVSSSFTASKIATMRGRIRIASGTPIASRLGRRQLLHQPHHVVGEVAENAGRHRRQARGHGDAAFGDQRAERGSASPSHGAKRVKVGRARDLRSPPSARKIRSGSKPSME